MSWIKICGDDEVTLLNLSNVCSITKDNFSTAIEFNYYDTADSDVFDFENEEERDEKYDAITNLLGVKEI